MLKNSSRGNIGEIFYFFSVFIKKIKCTGTENNVEYFREQPTNKYNSKWSKERNYNFCAEFLN